MVIVPPRARLSVWLALNGPQSNVNATTGPLARARGLAAQLQARQQARQAAARSKARSDSRRAIVLIAIAGVLALAGVAEVQALFCNMGPIRVREVLNRGDDRPLPAAVTLEGLEVPTSGTYDILNALVCCNGDLRLVVDGATRVVRAAEGVGAPLV